MSVAECGMYCAYCLSGNQGDNRKNSTTCVTNGKLPPDFVFEFRVLYIFLYFFQFGGYNVYPCPLFSLLKKLICSTVLPVMSARWHPYTCDIVPVVK